MGEAMEAKRSVQGAEETAILKGENTKTAPGDQDTSKDDWALPRLHTGVIIVISLATSCGRLLTELSSRNGRSDEFDFRDTKFSSVALLNNVIVVGMVAWILLLCLTVPGRFSRLSSPQKRTGEFDGLSDPGVHLQRGKSVPPVDAPSKELPSEVRNPNIPSRFGTFDLCNLSVTFCCIAVGGMIMKMARQFIIVDDYSNTSDVLISVNEQNASGSRTDIFSSTEIAIFVLASTVRQISYLLEPQIDEHEHFSSPERTRISPLKLREIFGQLEYKIEQLRKANIDVLESVSNLSSINTYQETRNNMRLESQNESLISLRKSVEMIQSAIDQRHSSQREDKGKVSLHEFESSSETSTFGSMKSLEASADSSFERKTPKPVDDISKRKVNRLPQISITNSDPKRQGFMKTIYECDENGGMSRNSNIADDISKSRLGRKSSAETNLKFEKGLNGSVSNLPVKLDDLIYFPGSVQSKSSQGLTDPLNSGFDESQCVRWNHHKGSKKQKDSNISMAYGTVANPEATRINLLQPDIRNIENKGDPGNAFFSSGSKFTSPLRALKRYSTEGSLFRKNVRGSSVSHTRNQVRPSLLTKTQPTRVKLQSWRPQILKKRGERIGRVIRNVPGILGSTYKPAITVTRFLKRSMRHPITTSTEVIKGLYTFSIQRVLMGISWLLFQVLEFRKLLSAREKYAHSSSSISVMSTSSLPRKHSRISSFQPIQMLDRTIQASKMNGPSIGRSANVIEKRQYPVRSSKQRSSSNDFVFL